MVVEQESLQIKQEREIQMTGLKIVVEQELEIKKLAVEASSEQSRHGHPGEDENDCAEISGAQVVKDKEEAEPLEVYISNPLGVGRKSLTGLRNTPSESCDEQQQMKWKEQLRHDHPGEDENDCAEISRAQVVKDKEEAEPLGVYISNPLGIGRKSLTGLLNKDAPLESCDELQQMKREKSHNTSVTVQNGVMHLTETKIDMDGKEKERPIEKPKVDTDGREKEMPAEKLKIGTDGKEKERPIEKLKVDTDGKEKRRPIENSKLMRWAMYLQNFKDQGGGNQGERQCWSRLPQPECLRIWIV